MTMPTPSKRPAIVHCSLGETGVLTTQKTRRGPRDLSNILLRIASHTGEPRRVRWAQRTIALDIRDGSADTLRTTIAHLSKRFQILALLPPIGVSSQHLHLGQAIAGLSDDMALPGFSRAAFATAMNRYLTRCHWQYRGLPTTAFSLVQFPSAIDPVIATIGLPARLSPLHYALPHLEAHILRNTENAKAYQLIARTLQRHTLTHPVFEPYNGEDPRIHHHTRFSFATDQLVVASPVGITVEFTLIIRDGVPQTVSASTIIQRHGSTQPAVSHTRIAKMAQLAIEGCAAIGIRTGIVSCLINHTGIGDFLDGIIPNYIDARIIPYIEKNCRT